MVNFIIWSIVIFTDIFLILIGVYSAYKFIRAYLDGKDFTKFQGYLVNSFLMILVFPTLITFVGLNIENWIDKQPKIGISIQTNDFRESNTKISFPSNEFELNEEKVIDLSVTNHFQENKKFSIDILCADEKQKCDRVFDLLTPNTDNFNVKPDVTFKLPISINLRDDIPSNKYNFNITVRYENNSVYDSIPLTVSVS